MTNARRIYGVPINTHSPSFPSFSDTFTSQEEEEDQREEGKMCQTRLRKEKKVEMKENGDRA